MSLKSLAVIGWISFGVDAAIVLMLFFTKNMGDDAAGRGMATGFAIVLAPVVLLAGAALWWAQSRGSFGGVLVLTLLLGAPFLLAGKQLVMGPINALDHRLARIGRGRFADRRLTAIAAAISKGDTAAVRGLTAGPGLDFTLRDAKGRTLLGIAVAAATGMSVPPGAVESARLLVAAGARYADDAIAKNGRMFSSLVYDTGDRHTELMEILLAAGANPNDTEEFDGRPLLIHHNMSVAKARILLAHGADLTGIRDSRSDRPGWDALVNAVYLQDWRLAALYLERGCDPSYRAGDGKTVRDIVQEVIQFERETGGATQSGPDQHIADEFGAGYDAFVAALARAGART